MRIIKYITYLTLAAGISACEDIVDIDIKQERQVLVVEGSLTNQLEPGFIKLYYTKPALSTDNYMPVRLATVILKENQLTETLHETSPGYYPIKVLKGREGKTYSLIITTEEGTYEAISKMPRLTMTPDTLEFKYENKSLLYLDEGYYPFINGQELKGIGDFTQFKLFKNNKILNKSREINLFSDEYVDGNYIGNYELEIDSPFVSGDRIRLEAWSLTKENYNFWTDIRTQLNNTGIFATPLPNARSNIRKIDPNSPEVTGFFGTSMVKSIEKAIL